MSRRLGPQRSAVVPLDRDRQAAPQIFERLRDDITSLRLRPGTPLSRSELAARFRISSTPVRDALMRLEEEGLVDVFPQHATVVSRIDIQSAHRAHFLRLSVELEIVRRLATTPDDRLNSNLTELLARQQFAFSKADMEEFRSLDEAFHKQLYDACDMADLWGLIKSRSGHIDRLRALHLPTPGKAQSIIKSHRLIAESIAKQQPDSAQAHLRQHLSGTLEYVPKIRADHPDFVQD